MRDNEFDGRISYAAAQKVNLAQTALSRRIEAVCRRIAIERADLRKLETVRKALGTCSRDIKAVSEIRYFHDVQKEPLTKIATRFGMSYAETRRLYHAVRICETYGKASIGDPLF